MIICILFTVLQQLYGRRNKVQFIFVKDSSGMHELLYTDGNRAGAERLSERINLRGADIDAFGYIAPGLGGSHAVFFRVMRDGSAPYGAYYVHGVESATSPEYFTNEKYKEELFAEYISQNELDMLRAGEKDISGLTADDSLYKLSGRFSLDRGVLTEIIARICGGEKLALIVSDADYSVSYCRALAEYIFRYLTPSCRGLCSFIAGCDDPNAIPGIRFRIIRENMIRDPEEAHINVSEAGHECTADPRLREAAEVIVDLTDEDRRAFFAGYEVISGGFQSKKLLDYIAAYKGDAGAAETLLDAYLSSAVEPKKEDIPAFISELVGVKYTPDAVSDKTLLHIGTLSDIIMPQNVLDENSLTVKKLWLYNDHADKYVALLYRRAASNMTFDDEALVRIWNAVSGKGPGSSDSDRAAYRECFYSGVSQAYDQLRARANEYFSEKSVVMAKLGEAFAVYPDRIITVERRDMLLDAIKRTCESKEIRDRDALVAAVVDEFYRMLPEHDRRCETIFGAPVNNINADEGAIQNLDALRERLDNNNIFEVAELILAVDVQFRAYPELVNAQAARYALIAGDSVVYGKDRVFSTFRHTDGRIYDIASRAASSDASIALCLLAAYDPPGAVFADSARLIGTYSRAYDMMQETALAELDKRFVEMLTNRAEENRNAGGTEGELPVTADPASTTGSAVLLRTVKKIWEANSMPKKKGFAAKIAADPVPFICGVVILGVLVIMIIIILLCGHIGRLVGEAEAGKHTTANQINTDQVTDEPGTEPEATEPEDTEPKETEPKETEPKETEPKETEPKETEPKETEPKETEPKETDPPETDPPETDPPETDPPETDPPETDPPETDPPETDPPETDPPETDPPETDPPETDPPETAPPETDPSQGQPGEQTSNSGEGLN